MEIERMLKLAGVTTLTEGKIKDITIKGAEKDEYQDFVEFEDAFGNMQLGINVIMDIAKSKAMISFIRDTKKSVPSFDENYFSEFKAAAKNLQIKYNALYRALQNASEY